MLKSLKSLVLLAAVVLTIAAPSRADLSGFIVTRNNTGFPIWVTIYETTGRQVDWGWVDPNSERIWRSGNYLNLMPYRVRGEIHYYRADRPPKVDMSETIVVCESKGGRASWGQHLVGGQPIRTEQQFTSRRAFTMTGWETCTGLPTTQSS